MKSSSSQLEQRGYLTDEECVSYAACSDEKLSVLLENGEARERTAAARILSAQGNPAHIPLLCRALEKEKKLYTRLALCEGLASYGKDAVPHLIALLGRIGSNQHRFPARCDLGKKSFPLPRDLAARIIVRIGEPALPAIEKTLREGDRQQICEAIDAAGHIAFYSGNAGSGEILVEMYRKYAGDDLVEWKIIRALQSYHSEDVIALLRGVAQNSASELMREEAERSLERIRERKC